MVEWAPFPLNGSETLSPPVAISSARGAVLFGAALLGACINLGAPRRAPRGDAAVDASDDRADVPDAATTADAITEVGADVPDVSDGRSVMDVPVDVAPDRASPDVFDAPEASIDGTVPERCTAAPRPLLPLAGTRLRSAMVTLGVASVGDGDGVEFAFGRDPAFTSPTTVTAASTSAGEVTITASTPASGVWFWRARQRCGSARGPWSPPWSFWTSGAGASVSPIGWIPDLDGDGFADLVLGAPHLDAASTTTPSVRVYLGASGVTVFGASGSMNVAGTEDSFGAFVAVVPDLNGDGRAELAVSACGRATALCAPRVYVYSLAAGASSFALVRAYSVSDPATRFGAEIAGVGDLDGDGYGDLLVAAPGTFPTPVGALYVVRGGATLPSVLDAPRLAPTTAPPAPTRFGWNVTGPGDVNGDGLADAVVTSFQRAWLYPGRRGSDGPFDAPVLVGHTAVAEGTYGFNASAAGDFNGDGLADFALARPGAFDGATANVGDVGFYYGARPFLSGTPPDPSLLGTRPGGLFGEALAGGGNVYGTTHDDLLVGAPGANDGAGETYLIAGGMTPLVALRVRAVSLPMGTGLYGRAVSIAGDHDGDGVDDFIVSAGSGAGASATSALLAWRGQSLATFAPWNSFVASGTPDFGFSLAAR